LRTTVQVFSVPPFKYAGIGTRCDVENIGSYRVMEKLGMRREGLFIEGRPAHKFSGKKYGDEL